MDKTPFQNEDTSSVEPSQLETNNAVIVKVKPLDVHSLPPKSTMTAPEPDTSALDDNWLALSRDWQSQPYEKTDIQALLKQTQKRTLLAKSLLAIDIIATVAIIIALLVGLYKGDWSTATIAYLTFGSLGSIVFVYYEIKIRLRIWQHSCDSPDNAVANAISGVESSIKYIKLIKLSCWFLLPAANWYIYVMIKESEKSPWPPFIVMNSFVIVMWLITHWFHKKRSGELAQFDSL